ncbi:hypothetical protein ACFFGH_16985 [Lysobacter korlensis]|uniref:Transmembrane protein n=1 Tax=Lysobacter korlensis TaxID=553636 RepID=A0ABV6RRD0_9GAMM
MTIHDELKSERFAELEALFRLAETSTENLDKLEAELDRRRVLGIISLLVGYVLIAVAFAALYLVQKSSTAQEGHLFYYVAAGTSMALGIYLSYTAFQFVRRRAALAKEKRVEIDIQKRLFVLIDEQMHRAIAYGAMSPVTRATYEIRARRMWRADEIGFSGWFAETRSSSS